MYPVHEREVGDVDLPLRHVLMHQSEPYAQQCALSVLVARTTQIVFHGLAFDLERVVLGRLDHGLDFDEGHSGRANILNDALKNPIVVV